MPITQPWQLRAEFARRLSRLYGREVPAYTTLLEESHAVNNAVLRRDGADAERLGAIRVGTPSELAAVARIFAALGAAGPIVYEDFLPKSAAGIFQSNLTSDGRKDTTQSTIAVDAAWMEGVLNRTLHDPYELYDGIRRASLDLAANKLGIRGPIEAPSPTTTQE